MPWVPHGIMSENKHVVCKAYLIPTVNNLAMYNVRSNTTDLIKVHKQSDSLFRSKDFVATIIQRKNQFMILAIVDI